jgi:hypothetical protein
VSFIQAPVEFFSMRHTRLVQSYNYQALHSESREFQPSQTSVRKCYTPLNIQAEVETPKERTTPIRKALRSEIVRIPNLASDIRKLHYANIQRDLTHRILMAKQQGNARLLELLETELQDVVTL